MLNISVDEILVDSLTRATWNPMMPQYKKKVSRLRLYEMEVRKYYVENKALFGTWK